MVKNQWDRYAKIFDKGIGDGEEDLHKNYLDPLIFKYLESKNYQNIVEVGCGNGYLLKKLSPYARNIIGLDYSSELLKAAEKRVGSNSNIKLRLSDVSNVLPIESNSVDVIVANMVLQYVPSLSVFSDEAFRILSLGGSLIIVVDHPGHFLFARAQELAGKGNSHFIDTGSYFTEGIRRKNSLWNKAVLEYYHRPLSGYINLFSELMTLKRVDEISQDDEIPRILGLKFIK